MFMRKLWVCVLLFFCISSSLFADEITGFWQTINKKTKLPSAVIAIYPYQGKYYGRIIATYDSKGEIDETIYAPKDRAPGVIGHPYYCGLDIVYDARSKSGGTYKGYVVDPKKGNVYTAELWKDNENLILRGKLFIFGKNVVWPPFPEENFNNDFKKPDISKFVPVIPKV